MRLATIKLNGAEVGGIASGGGVVPIGDVNERLGLSWETDLFELIRGGSLPCMAKWYAEHGRAEVAKLTSVTAPVYAPPYRHPTKLFGIGLNYSDHAGDLAERTPTGIPASFFKPATTIVGCGDEIRIPPQSQKTTAEAELGVIIGRDCENIERENWLDYVAGFTTVLDMTAEDILRLNPRYLTHVKSFATFFSFGPHVVTPDEIPDVSALKVQTILNGAVHAENFVSNMTFPPDFLVAFHSKVFKWEAGDVLFTGTPRAVQINHGDVAECGITGFEHLTNPVK
ncbi:MAG: fumarylacetoacetate hydrolase family protein [Synergistaceae bacterium]|jgi:2-keto-4-pentenoate hydratase/2-oxohepta-3-ene-1,7-dioic acid hydratase in catechol pathway|nr:fumarylacetoacetate hydrolase family protein [Synergistaceae bacterium]